MLVALLQHVVPHQDRERPRLLGAFAYFFCLLAGYYVLQPLRDELGGTGGVRDLPWLFMASMVVMLAVQPLYGALVARFPRRVFLPWVYGFFLLNMGMFWALLRVPDPTVHLWTARAFFLWVSVFNLFAVSVFWSFMADLFDSGQAKRLFGFIGAGGTAGQLVGSILTASLAKSLGAINLLWISMALLGAAIGVVTWLCREAGPAPATEEAGKSGAKPGAWEGLRAVLASPYLQGICAYIFLYTFTSSFLYFGKQEVTRAALSDPAARTAFFAQINLAVSVATLTVQLFLTGRLLSWMGISRALALVPAITAGGFLLLGWVPLLVVYGVFEVTRKAANYALSRPAREILYTVVTKEEKYQAKAFIDTFVYRGGDAVAAAVFAPIKAFGLGLAGTAMAAAPVAAIWGAVGLWLGRRQQARAAEVVADRLPVGGGPPIRKKGEGESGDSGETAG